MKGNENNKEVKNIVDEKLDKAGIGWGIIGFLYSLGLGLFYFQETLGFYSFFKIIGLIIFLFSGLISFVQLSEEGDEVKYFSPILAGISFIIGGVMYFSSYDVWVGFDFIMLLVMCLGVACIFNSFYKVIKLDKLNNLTKIILTIVNIATLLVPIFSYIHSK